MKQTGKTEPKQYQHILIALASTTWAIGTGVLAGALSG